MNPPQNAYIIENNKIKQVEIIKSTRDFITVRYKTYLPDNRGYSVETNGGIRLRKNRVYESKEDAEKVLGSLNK